MKILSLFLLLLLVASIIRVQFFSFGAQTPEDYASQPASFSLQEQLSGTLISEGLIYGPDGRVTNSFVAEMTGEWQGNTGTLREEFTYSNGKQQSREWQLTMGEGNTFTATADDIVGEGKGVVSGSTAMLTYTIILPEEAGGHKLNVTDWMYLAENGTILNRSEMRKFGIKVVELIATMRPLN